MKISIYVFLTFILIALLPLSAIALAVFLILALVHRDHPDVYLWGYVYANSVWSCSF